MLASLLAGIGSICSKATTTFTWWWFNEETDCPESLLK